VTAVIASTENLKHLIKNDTLRLARPLPFEGHQSNAANAPVMATLNSRILVLLAVTAMATSACGSNTAVPTATSQVAAPDIQRAVPADNTSILKMLKKDVKIGSTIDPKNGDMGPRAISLVRSTFNLKKGQLLVCNFADAKGDAGKGSTIEVLDPKPNSKPKTFVQDSKIAGCDGSAITDGNVTYASGLTSGVVEQFNHSGAEQDTYGSPIAAPFADVDAFCGLAYAPEDVYVADGTTGAIVKLEFIAVTQGKATEKQVISGFAVNKGSGWSLLAPSGLAYNNTRSTPQTCNDTLYAVDGVDNTLVAFTNVSSLLTKNEIIVEKGGKTFKCLAPKHIVRRPCANLVYSGSPLNAPVAAALLPNGNLIVANTKGGNTLVEISAAGKLLDTKTIDTNKTADIFGLLAEGTDDSNTVVYYTDTATNTLQELEP
jgi:hypothetical protein